MAAVAVAAGALVGAGTAGAAVGAVVGGAAGAVVGAGALVAVGAAPPQAVSKRATRIRATTKEFGVFMGFLLLH